MPTPSYRITVVKSYLGKTWSNDYLTIDATMTDAATRAVQLVEFERRLHTTLVTFDYYRVSTTIVGDRSFRHVAINQPGLRAGSTDSLPLYCTARLDMPTADSDPARKYYRLPVQEGEQASGTMTAATVTTLQGIVQTYFIATGAISMVVTSRGNPVTTAQMSNTVQMRQML